MPAQTVGVSMAAFDDAFLTVLRTRLRAHAAALPGVALEIADAGNDVGRQLAQVEAFAARPVAAIIVNPVDTDATEAMSAVAAASGVPLVYVNREPANADALPPGQALVASDERQSGTLEAREICRRLRTEDKDAAGIVVLMGTLTNQAARQRTQDLHDVIAGSDCDFMRILQEDTAGWSRKEAAQLVAGWLGAGLRFDAVVANNDAMALGAIDALQAAGIAPGTVLVGGIDATREALGAMQAGALAVTVFQDADGQAGAALDAALALARGETVPRKSYIPFQLVTPETLARYLASN